MRNKFLSDFISFWKKKSRSNLVRILAQSENNSLEKMLCSRHRILPNPHCCWFFFQTSLPMSTNERPWTPDDHYYDHLIWVKKWHGRDSKVQVFSFSSMIYQNSWSQNLNYCITSYVETYVESYGRYILCVGDRDMYLVLPKEQKNVWFNHDFTIFLEDHINFSQKLQPVFRYNM